MKMLVKVTAIVLLLVITLISINAAEGGSPSKVVIEGVGQPTVTSKDGSITWKCDATTSNKCTITITFQQ
jgi:hypothetical protein